MPTINPLVLTGRTYKHFNSEEFKEALSRKSWQEILEDTAVATAVATAWNSIYNEIKKELDCMCPIKRFTVKSQRPDWVTNDLLELMKDRDYFYKKAKQSKNEDDWNIAKHLRNIANFNVRQAKVDFILKELETHKNDPNKFWKTIKKVFPGKNKARDKTIKLQSETGRVIEKNVIPGYINDFFINIGKKIAAENLVTRTPSNSKTDTSTDTQNTTVHAQDDDEVENLGELRSKCLESFVQPIIQ